MDSATKPIYSSREDDPQLREPINEFVIRLSEIVDELQDAEANDDLESLKNLAQKLAEKAHELGYQPLAEVARHTQAASQDAKQEKARRALEELTDVSRRIRLGHRGAA